jgi:hypothetical protein
MIVSTGSPGEPTSAAQPSRVDFHFSSALAAAASAFAAVSFASASSFSSARASQERSSRAVGPEQPLAVQRASSTAAAAARSARRRETRRTCRPIRHATARMMIAQRSAPASRAVGAKPACAPPSKSKPYAACCSSACSRKATFWR